MEDLQCDFAIQMDIHGFEDLAHPPLTQELGDLVLAHCRPDTHGRSAVRTGNFCKGSQSRDINVLLAFGAAIQQRDTFNIFIHLHTTENSRNERATVYRLA